MIINIIICIIIVIIGVTLIIAIDNKHKIDNIIKRLDFTRLKIEDNLDDKKELIENTYNEIKENFLKKHSYYQEIIKNDLITFDVELTNSTNALKDLIADNEKISADKGIKQLAKEIKAKDEKLFALKSYYNDNVKLIKKVQTNFINKIILLIKKQKDLKPFEI